MHYRLYRPEDFPQLYAIELACFQPPSASPAATCANSSPTPDSATWIAEEDKPDDRLRHRRLDRTPTPDHRLYPDHRSRPRPAQARHRHRTSAAASRPPPAPPAPKSSGSTSQKQRLRHPPLPGTRLSPKGREENYYAPGIHALIYLQILTLNNPHNSLRKSHFT